MPRRPARALTRLRLRMLRFRLQQRLRRRLRLRLATATLLVAACAGERAPEAATPTGHLFANAASGVAFELPASWAGRYVVADSITTPTEGLERELTLRLRRADSTLVSEPMLVVRVFANRGWNAVPPESAATWWGTVIATDAERTVAVKPAAANPLPPGTADALAYDSLMMAALQRPMQASLRPPGR